MEKRFIIALFLITLVVILSNEYLWKQEPVQKPEEQSTEQTQKDSISKAKRETPITDTIGISEEKETEQVQKELQSIKQDSVKTSEIIVIDTELYRAKFSTKGAKLISWQLKEHLDMSSEEEEWLELIPQNEGGALQTGFSLTGDLSDYIFDVNQKNVSLKQGDSTAVVFTLGASDWKFHKKYIFYGDQYQFRMDFKFDGVNPSQIGDYSVLWNSGLNVTEKNEKDDLGYFSGFGYKDKEYEEEKLKDIQKKDKIALEGNIKWAGLKTKYFTGVMIPQNFEANKVTYKGQEDESEIFLQLDGNYTSGYMVNNSFLIYLGPIDYDRLMAINETLENVVDIGGILKFLKLGILKFFIWLYGIIPNYGIVIIIFSVLTKILFYPFSRKSYRSMREMSKIQPKMNEIKEKYKDNPKKQQEEMMALYKEHGVSPFSGCLPLLPQMPVFFALFRVLRSTIELRSAQFIPYWIPDLSQPDKFHLLPIMMGIAMFLQQKISPTSSAGGSAAGQQKMLSYFMPIFLTVIFFNFPSGLVLYWFTNNLMTIAQQYQIKKSAT